MKPIGASVCDRQVALPLIVTLESQLYHNTATSTIGRSYNRQSVNYSDVQIPKFLDTDTRNYFCIYTYTRNLWSPDTDT